MADKPNDKPIDKPKSPSVVPTGDAYKALKDDHWRWRVNVNSLGGLKLGDRVGVIHMQPGADIDRLVRIGALIPLGIKESAEAVVDPVQPVIPPYAVETLTPEKPAIPPSNIPSFDEAAKAHDARLADEAKAKADADAKADAEAKTKADADAKAKADKLAKAEAEMKADKK